MAKRKSKKFGIPQILACVAAVLGIAALVMLFVPALKAAKGDSSYAGWQIAFGYSKTADILGQSTSAKLLNFSFGNFLTYLLVLVGIAFAVLSLLGKLGKIAPVVSAAAFVGAGVLFFLALQMTSPYVGEATGDAANTIIKYFRESYALGAGAIVGGIVSILAGGAAVTGLFIKK